MPNLKERYRGAILGLATGDAVGTALEFKRPGTFTPITDMVGGGPFKLKPGQWTDDTSMMLCLGTSLTHCRSFDPSDQMERYTKWFDDGYMSSNGRCFDIGNTVYNALVKFKATKEPYCGSTEVNTAGNGSLMRLAPVPLAYFQTPLEAFKMARLSSATTHGALVAIDACRLMTALIIRALDSAPKEQLLAPEFFAAPEYWTTRPLCPEILEIAKGSYKNSEPPMIQGSGYAAKSLEAALWAFERTNSFEEGCLKAANLGEDADTTAAIYGQLAGAHYGVDGIPAKWRAKLAKIEELESLAVQLYVLSLELVSL